MDLYLELTEGDEEAWFRIYFSIFSNTFNSFPGLRGTDLETRLKIRNFYILSFTATNTGHLLIDCWIESRNLHLFSVKSFGTSRYPVSWNFDFTAGISSWRNSSFGGILAFQTWILSSTHLPTSCFKFSSISVTLNFSLRQWWEERKLLHGRACKTFRACVA